MPDASIVTWISTFPVFQSSNRSPTSQKQSPRYDPQRPHITARLRESNASQESKWIHKSREGKPTQKIFLPSLLLYELIVQFLLWDINVQVVVGNSALSGGGEGSLCPFPECIHDAASQLGINVCVVAHSLLPTRPPAQKKKPTQV